ncbi:MAG: hydrogenase [Desulfovibrionaceae bacterium]
MLRIIAERLHQGYRTLAYPRVQPQMPPRFLGKPRIQADNCGACNICTAVCPTQALCLGEHGPTLDTGRCLFCGACRAICPRSNIHFTQEHRLARLTREELLVRPQADPTATPAPRLRAQELFPEIAALYKKSLRLRQVSAGGCNACEADSNVLTTLVYDLGRFGIDFVASPRHADGLAVTGPVTENMRQALLDTYQALPDPRIIMAVGACAISGGLFRDSPEAHQGLSTLFSPDDIHVYIPGCPPHPWTILDGMLLMMGREKTG